VHGCQFRQPTVEHAAVYGDKVQGRTVVPNDIELVSAGSNDPQAFDLMWVQGGIQREEIGKFMPENDFSTANRHADLVAPFNKEG
jgi:hypothetical protein